VRRLLIASVVLALLAVYPVRRALDLAAAPTQPKDCPPFVPDEGSAGSPRAIAVPDLPFSQRRGTINDASCLNRTPVFGIVRVGSEEDVRRVLDMTAFNRIVLDPERQLVRVQSGATWHAIQNVLHPRFAIKAMQSTDIFTVGGSIAVNAHGMDHRAGGVGRTVRAMRVMPADGSIRTVSRQPLRRAGAVQADRRRLRSLWRHPRCRARRHAERRLPLGTSDPGLSRVAGNVHVGNPR